MTSKQEAARKNFKKAITDAQKLRKQNPKLTQSQALKAAFAANKKVGAVKKSASKKVVAKKAAPKKAAAKKVAVSHKDTKSHNVNIRVVSGIGALPIDFKGSFLGYRFYIVNQYQLDGTVTAQLIEIEGKGNIIGSLSGNPKENDRVTAALYGGALATGKTMIQPEGKYFSDRERKAYNKDLSDLEKKIKGFVVNLNKEVAAYNSGKDTTKKKSNGLKIVYKPETKKMSVLEEIKTILKSNKKILKGGYTLKSGVMREKKVLGKYK